jgi:hypothetical protein
MNVNIQIYSYLYLESDIFNSFCLQLYIVLLRTKLLNNNNYNNNCNNNAYDNIWISKKVSRY